MANNIEKCKQYVNNQVEHLAMFKQNLLCADLLVKPEKITGKTISYDRYSFANYVMGSYNRDSGATQKDLTVERVDRELTQDRGDTLGLDTMDKQEGQIADGLAGAYNFYQVKVEVPTIDGYAFGSIAQPGAQNFVTGSLTNANIVSKILNAEKILKNKRIKIGECLLYISVTANTLLSEAELAKAHLSEGFWNGVVDGQVSMFDKMKLIEVPDETLGCAFIICHPMAASVIDVLGIVNVFDKVPGKPGKAQIDVRDYFDAWVEPSGEEGIVIGLEAPRKPKLPDDFTFTTASGTIKVTGVEKGAKVYYGTSSASVTTELSAGVDGGYALPSVSTTTTYYVKVTANSVDSNVATVTATKA